VIGIVVVSHGQVAGELVNAARNIVGEVPAITAVSIGWADDMAAARERIAQALGEVGGRRRPHPHRHVRGHAHQREPALPVPRGWRS
jgi:hypothetical protein